MLPAFPASLTLCFGHLPAVLFAGSRGCYRTLVRLFQCLSSSLLLSLLLQISHFLLEEMLHVSFLLQIYHQLPMDATNTCPSLWRASRINFTSHTSNASFPERLWWCLCCDVCCSVWLRSDMIHCSKWPMWHLEQRPPHSCRCHLSSGHSCGHTTLTTLLCPALQQYPVSVWFTALCFN